MSNVNPVAAFASAVATTKQDLPTTKSSLNTTSLFGRIQKTVQESTLGQKVFAITTAIFATLAVVMTGLTAAAVIATPIGAIIAGASALVAALAGGLLYSENKAAQAQAKAEAQAQAKAEAQAKAKAEAQAKAKAEAQAQAKAKAFTSLNNLADAQPTFSQQMLEKGKNTLKAGLNYVRQNPVKTTFGLAAAAATAHVGLTYAKNLSLMNSTLPNLSLKTRLGTAAVLTAGDLTEQALNAAAFTLDHTSSAKAKVGNFVSAARVSAASNFSKAKTAMSAAVSAASTSAASNFSKAKTAVEPFVSAASTSAASNFSKAKTAMSDAVSAGSKILATIESEIQSRVKARQEARR